MLVITYSIFVIKLVFNFFCYFVFSSFWPWNQKRCITIIIIMQYILSYYFVGHITEGTAAATVLKSH